MRSIDIPEFEVADNDVEPEEDEGYGDEMDAEDSK